MQQKRPKRFLTGPPLSKAYIASGRPVTLRTRRQRAFLKRSACPERAFSGDGQSGIVKLRVMPRNLSPTRWAPNRSRPQELAGQRMNFRQLDSACASNCAWRFASWMRCTQPAARIMRRACAPRWQNSASSRKSNRARDRRKRLRRAIRHHYWNEHWTHDGHARNRQARSVRLYGYVPNREQQNR